MQEHAQQATNNQQSASSIKQPASSNKHQAISINQLSYKHQAISSVQKERKAYRNGVNFRTFTAQTVRTNCATKGMAERKQAIFGITLIGSIVNLLLVIFKFIAGFAGRSGAMVADAVHSLSDLVSDVIVLVFVQLASRPTDSKHTYGHGKFETMATAIISIILLVVGIGIFWEGGEKVWKALHGELLPQPDMIALWAALASIVLKEVLFRTTLIVGRRENSSSVIANAWHHRSDAFSSLGTAIGIGGAIFLGERWRILDPLAAVIVSILIVKVAIELLTPSINELLEKALPNDQQQEILDIICSTEGVQAPHNLHTRTIGNRCAIEVHIRLHPLMTVVESHKITQAIEQQLKAQFGQQTHISIHVEPIVE